MYLVAKYRGHGPDLLPASPELAARALLISRVHDLYIAPVQVRSWPHPCPTHGQARKGGASARSL